MAKTSITRRSEVEGCEKKNIFSLQKNKKN